jgi:hypothetical protein
MYGFAPGFCDYGYKNQICADNIRHLSSSSGSMLAAGPKVRGFKPGRGRWIFKGDKNP